MAINYTTLEEGRIHKALTGMKKGLFHEYSRDLRELNMIYKSAGYKINYKKFGGPSKLLKILTATHVELILEKM